MNIYLKSGLTVIGAAVVVSLIIVAITFADARHRQRQRGNDVDRAAVVVELRNYYNLPGEGAVRVSDEDKELFLKFHDTPMRELRRNFFARHRDDLQRFYYSGFDKLTIQAKKEGGELTTFTYDLSLYR